MKSESKFRFVQRHGEREKFFFDPEIVGSIELKLRVAQLNKKKHLTFKNCTTRPIDYYLTATTARFDQEQDEEVRCGTHRQVT